MLQLLSGKIENAVFVVVLHEWQNPKLLRGYLYIRNTLLIFMIFRNKYGRAVMVGTYARSLKMCCYLMYQNFSDTMVQWGNSYFTQKRTVSSVTNNADWSWYCDRHELESVSESSRKAKNLPLTGPQSVLLPFQSCPWSLCCHQHSRHSKIPAIKTDTLQLPVQRAASLVHLSQCQKVEHKVD